MPLSKLCEVSLPAWPAPTPTDRYRTPASRPSSTACSRPPAVAVTGAASAVGGYALQLAKADGLAPVVADAAPTDERLVRGLGADVVLSRGRRASAPHRAGT
ncbi:hypothetical protein GCM10010345_33600 [Streptomyces canarius]|uniref:Alcohol dehydrogenase-like C-terminal domain-containing protein n=1 Tax=Streptomyces canarius TaxID=285453 RepID=A0ABQ3CMK5_9ACTN|nr:hypothetical protein GCM10010345_33600 [Streptomyces canarius]